MRWWGGLALVLLLLTTIVAAGCASKGATAAVNLTNNTGDSLKPSLAIDKDDTVHLAYYDGTPGNNELFYRMKPRNGAWSAVVNVSKNNGESFAPKLLVSPQGNLYLAWHDDEFSRSYQVLFSSKAPGADWTYPVNVSATEQDSFLPSMVRDSEGTLHIVWTDITPGNWEIFYSSSVDGGVNWSAPINISNNEGRSSNPSLSIDAEDTLYVAWEDDITGDLDIRLSYKPKGGSWSEPENVSLDPGNSQNPNLLSDAQGNLYLAWNDETPAKSGKWEIYFATKPKGGSWSKPENISRNMGVSGLPIVALDSKDVLHLAWHDSSSGNYEIYHTTRAGDGTWAKPATISRTVGYSNDVAMVIDSKDTVHLAWTDNTPGNWDIYYIALPAKQS